MKATLPPSRELSTEDAAESYGQPGSLEAARGPEDFA